MHEDLLHWRREFPILERTVYMISNSLGPMPRGVRDHLREFTDMWDERGVRAWHEGWWEMPITVGNILCDIVNAPQGSITMHQNVAIADMILLSAFDFSGKRNKIVYTSMNFPSVMYQMEEQKRKGARIVEVEADEDGIGVDLDKLLAAIDEETLLVPVSHVLFRSSFVQDAKAIIEKAHSVGAKVLLDTYQSAGIYPLDVTELNVDFAVGGSVKWLLGGPGAGYLYVRPDHAAELKPASTGWQAHARPFEFERGEIDWAEGSWRFLNGTPHVPTLFACQAGYKIIREVGVSRIRERSLHLTQIILDEARARGIAVTCPPEPHQRAGTVALDVPNGREVCDELLRREIICDYRPKAGIRFGPHFFITEDECRRVVEETHAILKERGDA